MSLNPGVRLGPYEILAAIGAGGMGEVYRARDTRLGRDVAMKVLPEAYAADGNRRARFEREARLISQLSHRTSARCTMLATGSIRSWFLSSSKGRRCVSGSFAARCRSMKRSVVRCRLPMHSKPRTRKASSMALKPDNIPISPNGHVKVLDFGLAKVTSLDAPAGGKESPSITIDETREGSVIGSAVYMSPEQASGKSVDKRTDIWAFGCVSYEMLTRTRAFDGDDDADTIAAILRDDPDWRALPDNTPSTIRRLLVRCLEKDPSRRLRDIGDASFDLHDASLPEQPRESTRPKARRWLALGALVAGASIIALSYGIGRMSAVQQRALPAG